MRKLRASIPIAVATLALGCGEPGPLSSDDGAEAPEAAAKLVLSGVVTANAERPGQTAGPHVPSGRSYGGLAVSGAVAGTAELSPPTRTSPPIVRQSIEPTLANVALLPVGIEVTHTPSVVKATPGGANGNWNYYWYHATALRATGSPVTITEFGAYEFYDGQWNLNNFDGIAFTAEQFESWYSCPGASVSTDNACADGASWTANDVLVESSTKWVYVGVDGEGRSVKGEAVVEHIAELE